MSDEVCTREVALSLTLPIATGDIKTDISPLTGRIKQIIRHWPDGCRNLVEMAMGRGDAAVWILPNKTDTFVALNDATPVINCDEPVSKGEKLWMIGRNADGLWPHTIAATFIIEGSP